MTDPIKIMAQAMANMGFADVDSWTYEAEACVNALKEAGFVIVPVEPTSEIRTAMLDALHVIHNPKIHAFSISSVSAEAAWKAALTAVQESEEEGHV